MVKGHFGHLGVWGWFRLLFHPQEHAGFDGKGTFSQRILDSASHLLCIFGPVP